MASSDPQNGSLPSASSDSGADVREHAAALAERLLCAAISGRTRAEHAEAVKLGRLMTDPAGRAFTFAMVDQVFRSRDPAAEARRWRGLLRAFGVPRYLPPVDRLLMRAGAAVTSSGTRPPMNHVPSVVP